MTSRLHSELQRAPEKDLSTVSVVIPAYNAAATIERALTSVYAQTYSNIIEVIVVDDGSTDDTAEIIGHRFPQATLIKQENAGHGPTRNRGVQNATGELIAFLDADDEWLPSKLNLQAEVARQCPGAGIVLCQEITHTVSGEVGATSEGEALDFFTFRDWLVGRPAQRGFSLSCSGWLVDREAFRLSGGFSPTYRSGGDFCMLLKLAARGFCTIGIPRALFRRHMQAESVSQGPSADVKRARNVAEIVRGYAPGLATGADPTHCTEGEFSSILQYYLLHLFHQLALEGSIDEAREVGREASRLRGPWWTNLAARWFARFPGSARVLARWRHIPLRLWRKRLSL